MSTIIDTLIYDRTAQDIINDTIKAYISYVDLNRIEQASAYVANKLGLSITTKTWVKTDLRYASEMARIRNNLIKIKNALSRSSTPNIPSVIEFSSIGEANDIEKLLSDIDNYYQNIIAGCQRLSIQLGAKQLGNRGF